MKRFMPPGNASILQYSPEYAWLHFYQLFPCHQKEFRHINSIYQAYQSFNVGMSVGPHNMSLCSSKSQTNDFGEKSRGTQISAREEG